MGEAIRSAEEKAEAEKARAITSAEEKAEADRAQAIKNAEGKAEAERAEAIRSAVEKAEAERVQAIKDAEGKAEAVKAQAIKSDEIEREKVAANEREKMDGAAKASKDARAAVSKEKNDIVKRKIEIARQDFEMKQYIQTTLTAARTERKNNAGKLVQDQIEKLAGAAENVAETIHYIHQNRVDGLNKGVTKSFDAADALLKQKIQEVGDEFEKANRFTKEAVDRNNVRAHALAQDIIDRHGVKQFKKHEVCNKFRREDKKEERNTPYWVAEDTKRNAYVERNFTIPQEDSDEDRRRRLASMTPSEQVLARRRLTNRPKSHTVVLEALLEEINRLN